jgi:ferredoxin--NADP+ reductase
VEYPACNATVIARRDLSDGLAVLRIRPDEEPVPDFLPGQFIQLGLPCGIKATGGVAELEKRAYSIASSPADKEAFELLVALVPGGRLTPSLWSLRERDPCWIDPRPLGTFTLEHVPPGKELVLVATGTGIAPYVSMLRSYARGRPMHRPERWNRCAVVHGVRRSSDLAYADELRALCAEDRTLCYLPTVSREPESSHWSGLRGRVQAVLSDELCRSMSSIALHPEASHVFLCGNPSMIEEVRALLVERGFKPGSPRRGGNLHTERYW